MITYRKGWGGLFLVFRVAGTSWPYGVLPGLLSAAVGVGLSCYEDANVVISDEDAFIENPYPFQLFAYLVGFVIVFRTNFAYQRYWEAVDALQRMGAKLLDGACMVVAFDAPADSHQAYLCETVVHTTKLARRPSQLGESWHSDPALTESHTKHRVFFAEIMHLFSVLHALALLYLRSDCDLDNIEVTCDDELEALAETDPSVPSIPRNVSLESSFSAASVAKHHSKMKIEILGELLPEERALLETDNAGKPIHPKARVTMLTTWIWRRLINRQKHEKEGDLAKTSPPIVSRIYQVMSDGLLAFGQASKVAETPFPFPYQNLIREFLWLFAFTCPFVINSKIFHNVARFVMTFVTVWAYFSLAWVGDNLEDPFLAYDPNELPLLKIQRNFNRRLIALGLVPRPAEPPAPESEPATPFSVTRQASKRVGGTSEPLPERGEVSVVPAVGVTATQEPAIDVQLLQQVPAALATKLAARPADLDTSVTAVGTSASSAFEGAPTTKELAVMETVESIGFTLSDHVQAAEEEHAGMSSFAQRHKAGMEMTALAAPIIGI